MALPRWLARLNRAVLNPLEMRRREGPVLEHVGRVSGVTFTTPLDAHVDDDGVVLTPLYGPRTDWVRNVLATGRATLVVDGRRLELTSPRLVGAGELPENMDRPPRWLGPDRYLYLDHA